MEENRRRQLVGNLASFGAYLIFGFNIIFCKNIANSGTISPIALFCLRSVGAMILFWVVSFFACPDDRMDRHDLWKVALASFLGLFLTQLSFLKAITMTTAVDASILSLLSPVMAMIVAAIVLKDRITVHGVLGLAISFTGVLFLVLKTVNPHGGADSTSPAGVAMMILNTLSFACYVGIFKPLIQKYNVITFMKWMFVFSTIYALPFGIRDLAGTDWSGITAGIAAQIAFVVVAATFIAYFLIPVGQQRLKPMLVCMYSYVQPVVAMCISLAVGMDTMSWAKGLATLFVFAGVSIVNFSPKKSS